MTTMEERMSAMPERVSKLEGAYEQVDQRLGDLTRSVEALRTEMTTRLDSTDRRIDTMDSKFESKFNTLIIVVASTGVAVVGTLIAIAFRL